MAWFDYEFLKIFYIKMQTLKLKILSEKYMFPVGFEPTYPL